jgi:hypothetical protein
MRQFENCMNKIIKPERLVAIAWGFNPTKKRTRDFTPCKGVSTTDIDLSENPD